MNKMISLGSGLAEREKQNSWEELPVVELPLDYPYPLVSSFLRATVSFELKGALLNEIKDFCHHNKNIGLSEILLTCFNIFIYRYTSQEDVIVCVTGDPFSCISMVDGTAVLIRVFLDKEIDCAELLQRIVQATKEPICSFEFPPEKLNRVPVFCMAPILLDTFLTTEYTLSNLRVVPEIIRQCDLAVIAIEEKELLKIIFEYNSELFERSTIERFSENFKVLLSEIPKKFQTRIYNLPLLAEKERQMLLVEWNSTQADYPKNRCIHQLFEEQVRKTPDATVVIFEGQILTYRELNCRANQLAHHLRKLGVIPESLIGICLERSLEMIIGLLGILKAGGAYVPVDPTYPAERIDHILLDSKTEILITSSQLLTSLPGYAKRAVCLDEEWNVISAESEENPDSGIMPDNLCYVIYTSGSTGKPKGVQICHQSLVNFICSMSDKPGLKANDRLLTVTTICFDIHALEIYLPLAVGATIVLVSRQTAADGFGLISAMADYDITVLQGTPATWRMLLTVGWQGNPKLKAICGGEALQRKLAKNLLQRTGSLWNIYGPTEATVWSTVCQVQASRSKNRYEDAPEAIGRPIANTQIYILDSNLQPVPIGAVGELCIGGAGVARGYLNRPELTAERFIENPFVDNFNSPQLYKTGDLARYLSDGNIEYLGRVDHQVKLRGYRIELGEIEAALSQHEAISGAAVVLHERDDNKFLAAYLIEEVGKEKRDKAALISELRSWLRQRLPDYMIPASFTVLDRLPLTPNGKIDRRALPMPEQFTQEQTQSYTAAQDILEQQLIIIWEKILKIQPIGIHDNFFDIGGNSLLAVGLFAEIEKKFDRKLPVPVLLKVPTVEQLAGILRQDGWTPPRTALIPIQPCGSMPPFFYVPPGANTALSAFRYIRHLGTDQPVYGLQPLGFEEGEVPHDRVEDMASYYLNEIKKLQPEGPYYIGGECFGTRVAFEMAQQLQAQGCTVALLAILDPGPPCHNSIAFKTMNTMEKTIHYIHKTIYHLKYDWLNAPAKSIYYIKKVLYYIKHGGLIDALMEFFIYRRRELQVRFPSAQEKIQVIMNAHNAALMRYKPTVYSGKITLFRSSEYHYRDQSGFWIKRWSEFAGGGFECHVIQGTHVEIFMEPKFKELVSRLKECLNKAHNCA